MDMLVSKNGISKTAAAEETMVQPGVAYPPKSYAYAVVAILMIATFHSQLDRQFPALLVESIRTAFGISDTQFSLFQGAAFGVLYAIIGPVFGRFVDYRNRRNLIIFGILFWSVMTMLSGIAHTFWQLVITRMGTGVGEAVLAPAAYSLIADYMEPRVRGRAMGIYQMSNALGTGASLLLGGAILSAASHGSLLDVPYLRDLAPWQLAFILVGTPGLITALVVLLVREPVRREDGSALSIGGSRHASSRQFFRYIYRNKVAFGCVLISQVIISFIGNAIVPWLPTIFIRTYGIAAPTIGFLLGIELIVGSVAGFYLSGYLSDLWLREGYPDARLLPIFVGELLFIPTVFIWPLAGNFYVSYGVLALQMVGHVMAIATLPTVTQEIVPNRMRGQAVTLVLMVSTLLGWTLGPTAVALVTDHVFHNDNAVPYSLVSVTVPMAIIAFIVAWLGRKAYGETRRRLLEDTTAPS